MKSIKIVLALLGGLLFGLGWILLGEDPVSTSRLISGAIFSVGGFACLYWGIRRITWKFFVYFQVPFFGLLTWNLARLHAANQTSGILVGSAAFLAILAAITFIETRLSGDAGRDGESNNAEQGGDGEKVVRLKSSF